MILSLFGTGPKAVHCFVEPPNNVLFFCHRKILVAVSCGCPLLLLWHVGMPLTSPVQPFHPFASAVVRSVRRMLNMGVDAYSVSVSAIFSVYDGSILSLIFGCSVCSPFLLLLRCFRFLLLACASFCYFICAWSCWWW